MLSIEELRRHLNRPGLTDEQVADLRDTLYCFARVLVEGYVRGRQQAPDRERT
jgi:hypothetical protein